MPAAVERFVGYFDETASRAEHRLDRAWKLGAVEYAPLGTAIHMFRICRSGFEGGMNMAIVEYVISTF